LWPKIVLFFFKGVVIPQTNTASDFERKEAIMRKLSAFLAVLAGLFLLATPLAALAQTDPVSVINSFATTYNAGNASAATATFTSDASVTWNPAESGPGNKNGMAAIQSWLQEEVKDGDKVQLLNVQATGDKATFTARVMMPDLQQAGVDYLEFQAVSTLSGGKIKSIAFTATSETLDKLSKLGPPPGAGSGSQGQGGAAPGVPQTGAGGASATASAQSTSADLIATYWPWAAGVVGLVVVIGLARFFIAKRQGGARPR
jgi:hypothetical protein